MNPCVHSAKKRHYFFGFGRFHDDHKTDPVIEHAIHLFRRNIALFTKEVENWGRAPGILPDDRPASAGENSFDIVVETAPGNVSHPVHAVLAQKMQHDLDIDV